MVCAPDLDLSFSMADAIKNQSTAYTYRYHVLIMPKFFFHNIQNCILTWQIIEIHCFFFVCRDFHYYIRQSFLIENHYFTIYLPWAMRRGIGRMLFRAIIVNTQFAYKTETEILSLKRCIKNWFGFPHAKLSETKSLQLVQHLFHEHSKQKQYTMNIFHVSYFQHLLLTEIKKKKLYEVSVSSQTIHIFERTILLYRKKLDCEAHRMQVYFITAVNVNKFSGVCSMVTS